MKLIISLLTLGIGFAAQAKDDAPGDPVAGKAKAVVCTACHGGGGQSELAGYPKIAGQNEQYLVYAMNAYKNGERTGALAQVMKLQSQVLTKQDIKNLAAYYSQLKE